MQLPAFTAEAALRRGTIHTGSGRTSLDPPGIVRPAIGGPGSIDKGQCLSDCLDAGLSPAACHSRCSDVGPGGGGGGGGGGVGQTACLASCDVAYNVCVFDTGFFGLPVCRAIRNSCKSACRRNVVN
jgi:hypothetical protein